MGSGIAKQIKEKYPAVFKQFKKTEPTLGKLDVVKINEKLYIGNCYTQIKYGTDKSVRYAYPIAVQSSLIEATKFSKENNNLQIKMPWIGCGLGNIDKETVKFLIEDVEKRYSVIIEVYEV